MKRSIRTLLLPVLSGLALLVSQRVNANNIATSTGSLTGNTGTTVQVQFNVAWENSWRINPDRWDAAWIFVKYRSTDGLWRHASLSNTGHVAPSGSTIATGLLDPAAAYNASTNPGVGAFIYRSADGSGTFSANGVQLLWNYGVNGVSLANVLEVRVFAIETVYVPQGAFAAGSGGSETNAFTLTTISTATASTAPTGSGGLGGQAGGYPTGQTAPVASFPNGFGAFYCMKYEMSQQGYVDFLNTLTYDQQVTRTSTAPNSTAGTGALNETNQNRNGIDTQTPGVASTTPAVYACNLNGNTSYGEATDGMDIACNYLNWGDLTAYLDWSGLRPMTELEYEKACRGTIAAVANEFAWGTAGICTSVYTLANAGANNEGIATNYSTTLGNAGYSATTQFFVTRVGIYAANAANSGRVTAGASYYGIMELTGNLFERPVTIGNANGRAFTGTHGNGALVANGDPDGTTWPAPATADGSGYKGGCFIDTFQDISVSNRGSVGSANTGRYGYSGGRGVRTAP